MLLEGSCHCGAVRFTIESQHPFPFNVCYGSICRKTAGAGGSAINLSGRYDTLKVHGEDQIRVYHAKMHDAERGSVTQSPAERKFCGNCGSALWLWDPRWPELVHPHASVIDAELPVPPERTHLMLDSKPAWVKACVEKGDQVFGGYPEESIADWHQRLNLEK